MGGAWDATNVADGDGRGGHADRRGPRGATSATRPAEIAREKAGIIKPGAMAVLAGQAEDVAAVIAERGRRGRRDGAARGPGVRRRAPGARRRRPDAVRCRACAATYDEIFLPLHGAHQAENAALRAGRGRGVRRRQAEPLDPDVVRAAFAAVRLARPAGGRSGAAPTIVLDAAHNPHGAAATAAALQEVRFTRLIGVVGVMRDKDVRGHARRAGAGARRDRLHPELTAAGDAGRRAGRGRPRMFGADRVSVEPLLDDAIEQAGELAEEGGGPARRGSGGVLVTGSVVTAGEARRLLEPRGTARRTPPDRGAGCAPRCSCSRHRARARRPCCIAMADVGTVRRAGIGSGWPSHACSPPGCRRPVGLALGLSPGRRDRLGLLVPAMFLVGLMFAAVWAGVLPGLDDRPASARARGPEQQAAPSTASRGPESATAGGVAAGRACR